METPPREMGIDDFNKFVMEEVHKRYERIDSHYRCRKCGTRTEQVVCYVSLHMAGFSFCSGSGKVGNLALLYCPKCEGAPKKYHTCVHIPMPIGGSAVTTFIRIT